MAKMETNKKMDCADQCYLWYKRSVEPTTGYRR